MVFLIGDTKRVEKRRNLGSEGGGDYCLLYCRVRSGKCSSSEVVHDRQRTLTKVCVLSQQADRLS